MTVVVNLGGGNFAELEPERFEVDAALLAPLAPLNFYGAPVVPAEYFAGEHVANPGPAGGPPVCSCGWTRHRAEDGSWFELADHLADMGAGR